MTITRVRGNAVEASDKRFPTVPFAEAAQAIFGVGVESFSHSPDVLATRRPTAHPFVLAAVYAFDHHLPLVLSPDSVWLLISQGFGQHLLANAEAYRSRFVAHEGKEKIIVRDDTFVKGASSNDWQSVLGNFERQIRDSVGNEKHALLVQHFSTTGGAERASFAVSLMTAMQSYFSYEFQTRCGIPEYLLEGTPDDWRKLRDATIKLSDFDLAGWVTPLTLLLDQCLDASEGKGDHAFWADFVSVDGASGGPYITGHINKLFPYLCERNATAVKNAFVTATAAPLHSGPMLGNFPRGLSVAPFVWEYYDQTFSITFEAGFVGVEQAEITGALKPVIGWDVCDHTNPEK